PSRTALYSSYYAGSSSHHQLSRSSLSYHPFCFSSNAPAPPEIYTLSLHDALPIWHGDAAARRPAPRRAADRPPAHHGREGDRQLDRKSTRLNSSHGSISYAVFCLKKKKKNKRKNNPNTQQ